MPPPFRLIAAVAVVAACAASAAAEPAVQTVVYVVRHAEKAAEPSRNPGLTPRGEERAAALATVLADAHLTGIVTTQFRRTRATAAPTVAASNVEPISIRYQPGTAEAHAEEVVAAIRARFPDGAVLVVGHSDTVPAIVHALGGPVVARLCEPTEYASLFTVVLGGAGPASAARSRYGPADPPLPAQCRSAPP